MRLAGPMIPRHPPPHLALSLSRDISEGYEGSTTFSALSFINVTTGENGEVISRDVSAVNDVIVTSTFHISV